MDVGPSLKNNYVLEKLNKHNFHIGRKVGADLKIRDFTSKDNLNLVATVYKGVNCLKPSRKELPKYKFISQRFKNLIAPGDKFETGSHHFEYKQ